MHIRVLGPIEVLNEDGIELRLGGPKQRTALALLVADVGKVVSVDALIDGLWGDEPTPGARSTLQTYVSNLRTVLGDVIVREGGGYRLDVEATVVDAVRFGHAVAQAKGLTEAKPAEAAQELRAVLALWRGHPYAGVTGCFRLELEARRLEELRLVAVETRIAAELAMGQHAALVPELDVLCTEFPFQEGFRAQHMLALYRSGRQADALGAFQKTRTYLVDELGLDASEQLRELERRILNHDTSLLLETAPQVDTLAFLLTDIEDSTVLWEMQTEAMRSAMEQHDRIVRSAVEASGGRIVKRVGDGVDSAFADVSAAAAAAREIQRELAALDGLPTDRLRVRMVVDVGEVEGRGGDYFGPVLNRAGRILASAHGGQVLVSADAHAALAATASGWQAKALGEYRFKGIGTPVTVFQLLVDGLPSEFPPLRIDRLPPPISSFGHSVRGYELREEAGSGAFGVVYRAYQPSVGREVGIKVIRSDFVNRLSFVRSFEAEARLVAQLEHPHIVSLYDYWRDPDGAYLVMRWLRGGALRETLERGPWNLEPAARLLAQIAGALSYAHRQGVIHGDLKPANVLLDDEGHAYLSDFGNATRLVDATETQALVTSSPAYVSPEELEGAARTPRSDIYSLGLLTYELLTGRRPPMDGALPSVRTGRPELRAEIDGVIAKATAPDPEFRHDSADAFLRAFELASGTAAASEVAYTEAENPYKGLRAFGENDAEDFYGRESLVAELIAAVGEHRLVAVVGPSGIGKSSVVKAGLIPALRNGALAGSKTWVITDMFPGSYPFEELAAALLRVAVERPDELVDELARDELGMRRVAKRILPPDTELLLVIDQFEELFTLTTDEGARRRFLEGLTQLAADSRSRVHVVLTIRADFLDHPLRHPDFGDLVKSGMVAVTTPSDDDLAAAIAEPAERVGVRFEPGLVSRIIGDVRDQPGALPLLQYALTELFARRTTDVLTSSAYLGTGGVVGALGHRAEALCEQLDEPGQAAARHVFLRLVTVDAGSQDTRRRVRLRELRHLELDSSALDEILQQYGEHRLLTFDRDPVTRSPTVEVAHEALLAQWERLREWVDERREDLVLHRRMVEAVSEWEESGGDTDYLPHTGRLAQFETWAQQTDLALSTDERRYLAEGRREEDDRRARNAKRRRAVLSGFALATVVAMVLAALAVIGRQDAKGSARLASSRELGASAIGALDRDPELSLLLAVKAAETAHPTFESVSALHQALLQDRVTWTLPALWAADFNNFGSLSPDGHLLLLGAPSGFEVWNVDRRKRLWGLHLTKAQVPLAHFSSDGSRVIGSIGWDTGASARPPTGVRPGIHIWNAATGREVMYRRIAPCPVVDMRQNNPFLDLSRPLIVSADVGEPTPDGIGCASGTFQVSRLDFGSGKRRQIAVLQTPLPKPSVAVSADARYVALADTATVSVLDTTRGREVFRKRINQSDDYLALTADGGRLVEGGGFGGPLTLWDVRHRRKLREIDNRVINAMALGRHDKSLLTVGFDGVIRLWDLASGRETLTLRGQRNVGGWAGLSADGTRLASFAGGDVRLWTLKDRGEVGAFKLDSGTYPSDGLDVAGGRAAVSISKSDAGGDAVLFDPSSGAVSARIPDVTGQVIRLSPDGRRLAAEQLVSAKGRTDGPILVHDLGTGAVTKMQGACIFAQFGENPQCKEPPATPFEEWNWTMEFSPDGRLLAVSNEQSSSLQLWDSRTGKLLLNRVIPDGRPSPSLAFSPDGRLLVAAPRDALIVYDTRTWKVLTRAHFDAGFLRKIEFTPDGKHLVGISQDAAQVVVFDTKTLKQTASLIGHEGLLKDLDISPDGTNIASSDAFGVIRIWDVKTGSPLEAIPLGETQVQNVEFLDNRHLMVTPYEGPVVYVLSIDVNELLRIARNRLTRGFTRQECQTYLHMDTCPTS